MLASCCWYLGGFILALPSCCLSFSFEKPLSDGVPEKSRHIGDHIRKRRYGLKLLQKEVGKKMGVVSDTVKNWENGHSAPEERHWPGITKFLGYDPMPLPQTVPERVRAIRWRLGLSAKQIAIKMGIDPDTFREFEAGRLEPDCRTWPAFIKLLGSDPRPEPKTFAEKVLITRTRLGMSQKEFAMAVGVRSASTIGRWESGVYEPPEGEYPNIKKLLKRAGV